MKTQSWFFAVVLLLIFAASVPAYATLDQALTTVGEGAVEFPMGLVKLVGGLVWTVGEVLVLPFRTIL